ncbi:MAG: 3,4-dihydroxy-2-butanone-4-phosphate synthase [Rhodospirillales bacterium]|nr:3,4-dihydroxy-2-butanone-4-phosphate synthase [Rhodospirillales bacterium]
MKRVSADEVKRAAEDLDYLSPIEEIIEDARNGKMYILVDDEDRENEGDLIIPAQMATPDAVNFMATHGRGLICLSMTRERIEALGIPLMPQHNESRHGTAFTVSIEAKEGVDTGISAPDRARTIAVAIDPTKDKKDLATPGHVFPLVAQDGGVLVRTGHTEASVDISRMAGLNPSAVICEIMNEDGTMSRLPELVKFAQFHGLKIGCIADLIAYRLTHDKVVTRSVESTINSVYGGEFKMYIYTNELVYAEHIALVKGDVAGDEPVYVRMHGVNMLNDILAADGGGKENELQTAMRMISETGGVLVLIREPRATTLSDTLTTMEGKTAGPQGALRDYGIGAQIIRDLGVKNMTLLTNTKRNIVGLEGYGLRVVGQKRISNN